MRTAHALAGGPRTTMAQLARAGEILTVLSGSGFSWLVQALGLGACGSPRCRAASVLRAGRRCPHQAAADRPLPERLRETVERLGPTFVKAGPMLALRPDYVPLEYAAHALHEHWHQHRFEYLDLAMELPRLLPEAVARLRHRPAGPAHPEPRPARRRWLPLGAFAAGAAVATLAGRRRPGACSRRTGTGPWLGDRHGLTPPP